MAFNLRGRANLGGISLGVNIPIGVDPKKANRKTIDIGTNTTSDNSINRMLSNVKKADLFSRPCLYKVFIHPPGRADWPTKFQGVHRGIQLNCNTVSIPGHTMATKEHKTYGLKREYAYEKLYDTVEMSFYMSDKMHEFNFFNAWLNSMYDNGRVSYYDDYKGTIEIFQLSGNVGRTSDPNDDEDLTVMMSVKLIDAYPKVISPLPLGHALANEIQKMSVTITYRDIKYLDYTKQDATKSELEKLFDGVIPALNGLSEAGTLIQDAMADLGLPKAATLLKKKFAGFLPLG